MEKYRTLGTNMVCACYLFLKEANIHINLICFDRDFDHPHMNVVHVCPQKTVQKPHFFLKNLVFAEKVTDMYLLSDLSSLFSQNSRTFKKNCYLIVVPLNN